LFCKMRKHLTGDASILRVERLSYRYPTGEVALRDVSLSVGLHEVVGLVGPNGAGKTTLLLHLNGLLLGTMTPTGGDAPGALAFGSAGFYSSQSDSSGTSSRLAPVE